MKPTTETETEIIFDGDLILTEDFKTEKNLIVRGRIFGKAGEKWNIDAWNINAGNINAGNINAWNINAWNINAGNINAGDIHAGDIHAGNIDAWNINAGDIDAGDIHYYAFCFSYENIKCKSIEGRRKNFKHLVLDGEITITEGTKCKTCGK